MVTLKVWQLMLGGLALLAAVAFMTMRPGSGPSAAPTAPARPTMAIPQQTQLAALRASLRAVSAYGAKHKGYAGMKLVGPGVTVAQSSAATFCLETAGPAPHVFKNGPTAPVQLGTCSQPSLGRPTG